MSIIIFNFLAHLSVILSLNHVLLWDNVKVNVKKNSVEFRGLTSVNTKQEIWMQSVCDVNLCQRCLK